MYNSILDGAAARLEEHFPGITIYTEAPEQDVVRPCFLVRTTGGAIKNFIGRRLLCSVTVDVQYLAEAEGTARDINRTADSLLKEMEYITLEDGSVLRGTNMRQEFAERRLDFYVSYSQFIMKPGAEEEAMDALEARPELRKE